MSVEILLIVSIIISLIATKSLIPLLRRQNVGQPIRAEGNKQHYAKAGTPTMGGMAFISVFIVLNIYLLFRQEQANYFQIIIIQLATLAYGAIGFIDDYTKVKKKDNLGLTEKQKIILQVFVALILSLIVYFFQDGMSYLVVPIININFDMGIFVIPVMILALVGATNAVNLTDGIDGLLASVSIPVFFGIFIIASELYSSISLSALIFAGVLIGYLAFNANPASIFMGDTGSMAIGAAITMMMLLMNLTLYLLILGAIYVAEALSVIIQVISFKTRGKRVFLMSPIHHHFELKGHKEPKIVANFMIISIILTSLTIYLVK